MKDRTLQELFKTDDCEYVPNFLQRKGKQRRAWAGERKPNNTRPESPQAFLIVSARAKHGVKTLKVENTTGSTYSQNRGKLLKRRDIGS